jgi:outer membrane receptor protein involved in Fe transport
MKFRPIATTAPLLACLALLQTARGQTPEATPPTPAGAALPDVQVIGTTPLLGAGVDKEKVPAAVNVLTPQDIGRTGIPSLTDTLTTNIPSVSINDTSGNPFQPDILFRGFTASPVEGETQGLAVYVNGMRFNAPFGDTVNWDLIPSNAIAQVNVEGGNPVFGLNALGGSVNVKLKDGFTYHGGEFTTYGGSFDRGAGLLQYGAESDNTSAYVAADGIFDGGWRKTSASSVRQIYTNLGWRGFDGEAHLSVMAADNLLGNPGATPEDLLAVSRSAASTAPNTVNNQYVSVNLSATYDITDRTSLQTVTYLQHFAQKLENGVTVDYQPCDSDATQLCENDGATQITDVHGNIVPSSIAGANGYSGLSIQNTKSNAYGTSAQVTDDRDLFGFHNRGVAGFSVDASETGYTSNELVGGLDANRYFTNPSYLIDQADLSAAPVNLRSYDQYYGLFFSDHFDLTNRLTLSLSGRFNLADVSIHDQLGTVITSSHEYQRFNPGVGVTWHVLPPLSLYANYSEANRAPTPNETECSNPAIPCLLPNAFLSDPTLKQVVARTVELGARGRLPDVLGGRLTWDGDFFHSENSDDIIFVSAPDSNAGGNFANAGRTLRQGFEATLSWKGHGVRAALGYTYTDATYQSALTLNSPNNPASDPTTGTIQVVPGDRLPGVPLHRGNLVVDYDVTDRLTVGTSVIAASSQYLFFDDANLTKPLGGYVVTNINASYKITDRIQVFGLVDNVLVSLISPNFVNTRVYSPAAPIAAYGGVRVTF